MSRRGKRARAREDEMNAMFNTEPFAASIGSGSEEGHEQEKERGARRPFSLYGIFKAYMLAEDETSY